MGATRESGRRWVLGKAFADTFLNPRISCGTHSWKYKPWDANKAPPVNNGNLSTAEYGELDGKTLASDANPGGIRWTPTIVFSNWRK